jgi:hypothetical protein
LTIQDLGSLGELLAAVATLATLGYLAVQVGQAKRQIETAQMQARSSFSNDAGRWSAEIQLRWFSPSGPNPTMMKALFTEDRLTQEEAHEFAVQISIFLGELIRTEQLQRRGLLDPEMATVRRSIYMPYLAMPRVRKWWERFGREFYAHDEDACGVVQDMLDEIDARAESAGV